MDFGFISITLLVLSAVFVLLGLKILFKRHWFLGFIRGFSGFSLLILATVAVLVSVNIASYNQLAAGRTLANVSFTQQGPQVFEAVIVNAADGERSTYVIYGDMWQADARLLRIASQNNHFFKLQSLSSRYYSLEQEHSTLPSSHRVESKQVGIDLWKLFRGKNAGIVAAANVSSTFTPMADGAVYSLDASAAGLSAKPVNETAKQIVSEWQ